MDGGRRGWNEAIRRQRQLWIRDRIRTLEDAVGTRLFDRDTRSVQPVSYSHLTVPKNSPEETSAALIS